ncbi:MAG: hypothetical protein ACM3XM_04850, partial [Mycobacterium leprae]
MRRSLVVLLAVLLLAGCARQAPTVTADPPTMPPTGPTEQAPTAPVVTDAAPPVPIKDVLPVPGALPEGLRRVELAAESPIAAAGVYFMDVPTGKLEAWLAPGEPTPGPSHVNLSASADGRWITATGGDSGYLIRRSDGTAFRYDSKRVNLEAGPGVLLAWEPGGFECAFLSEEMKLISTFTLGQRAGCGLQYGRLFSPDGKSLAVATPEGSSPAVLVNVATGAAKGLGEFVTRDGLSTSSVGLAAFPQLDQLVVELWL